jgi:beta-lactamase regulating signal transducer with metallopeptidase domain
MFGLANNSLNAFIQAWGNWMWGMSLHVTWLVVLLWLLDRPLRRTSARLRFVIWTVVLMRLVIPPGLALPTGVAWWVGDWFAQRAEAWTLTATSLATEAVETSADSAQPLSPSHSLADFQWPAFFFTLWLGFILTQLFLTVLGWRQVRAWLAQSTPLNDAQSLRILASASNKVGMLRPVQLRDSGRCTTPLVIGCWRPVILLPSAVRESLSAAELETVIVHELTHIVRGDSWWRLLQGVLGIVYFFHPAVWLARHKLDQVCEEACDEQTLLALNGRRRDYAQALVKAATIIGYRPPALALNMIGEALPVKRRLERILDPARQNVPGGTGRRWLAALCLALIVLPSGIQPTQATPPSSLSQAGLPTKEVQPEPNVADVAKPSQAEIEEETAAIEQLSAVDMETRLAAYETLERVGTLRALRPLEAAFLNRRGIEQDAAKRALDHVWSLIRKLPTETTQTSRQFQSQEEG